MPTGRLHDQDHRNDRGEDASTRRSGARGARRALPALAGGQVARIEVGSPNFKPLPFAIAPFLAEPGGAGRRRRGATGARERPPPLGPVPACSTRSRSSPARPRASPPEIQFPRWATSAPTGLVKARVPGAERARGGVPRCSTSPPAARCSRRGARAAKPRALAHRFADEIVRHYTREPGVFSTRIAAIRRARGGTRSSWSTTWTARTPRSSPGRICSSRLAAGRRRDRGDELPGRPAGDLDGRPRRRAAAEARVGRRARDGRGVVARRVQDRLRRVAGRQLGRVRRERGRHGPAAAHARSRHRLVADAGRPTARRIAFVSSRSGTRTSSS